MFMGGNLAARPITVQSSSYLLQPYFSLLPVTDTKISRPFAQLLSPNYPHDTLFSRIQLRQQRQLKLLRRVSFSL